VSPSVSPPRTRCAALHWLHITTTYRVTDDARTREFTVQPQPPRPAEDQHPSAVPLIPPALGAVKEAALLALRDLAKSLDARGFTVRLDPDDWTLIARNEATVEDDDEPSSPADPLAVVFGPVRLTQRVTLALTDTGDLYWHWQWTGPERGSPPEYQPMCPAAAIADATERISRVLALAGS
jgi:hypothetical protein